MGEIRINVEVAGPKGRRLLQDVLVDTGATYSSVTATDADAIGLVPIESFDVVLADGTMQRRWLGEARITIDGRSLSVPVAIAPTVKIGLTTLEPLRLRPNPVTRKLESVPALDV